MTMPETYFEEDSQSRINQERNSIDIHNPMDIYSPENRENRMRQSIEKTRRATRPGPTIDSGDRLFPAAESPRQIKRFEGMPYGELFDETGPEDWRAEQQSNLEKWAGVPAKFTTIATTSFLDSFIGTVWGGIEWLGGGSFVDNTFSNFMLDIQEGVENLLPIYRTQAELDAPWYERLGSANLWADVVINQGFTAGTVGAAALTGGLLGAASRGMQSFRLSKGVANMAAQGKYGSLTRGVAQGAMSPKAASEQILKASAGVKNRDPYVQILSSLHGSTGYARIESVGHARQLDEELTQLIDTQFAEEIPQLRTDIQERILSQDPNIEPELLEQLVEQEIAEERDIREADKDEILRSHINSTFALDLFYLTLTNQAMFGKLFSGNYKLSKSGLDKLIKMRDPEKLAAGLKTIKKGKVLPTAGHLLKNPTIQFFEESALHINREAGGDFSKAQYDPEATADMKDFWKTWGNKLVETFGDVDNWESGVMGFLGGSMGALGPVNRGGRVTGMTMHGGVWDAARELSRKGPEVSESFVNSLNEKLQDGRLIEMYKGAVRRAHYDAQAKDAVNVGDEFTFDNATLSSFISDLFLFEELGLLQEFNEYLDMGNSITPEQMKDLFKTNKNTEGIRVEDVDTFSEISETDLRAAVTETSSRLQNISKRALEVKKQITPIVTQRKFHTDEKENRRLQETVIKEMVHYAISVEDLERRMGELRTKLSPAIIDNIVSIQEAYKEGREEERQKLMRDLKSFWKDVPATRKRELMDNVAQYTAMVQRVDRLSDLYEGLETNEGAQEFVKRAQKEEADAFKLQREIFEEEHRATLQDAMDSEFSRIKQQESALGDLGYTQRQIDAMPPEDRGDIIETQTTPRKEADWDNLIDNAVNEKELDAIIDQMDEAGAEPNFERINKKREELVAGEPVTKPPVDTTPKDTPTQPTIEEPPLEPGESDLRPDDTDLGDLLDATTEPYTEGDNPILDDEGVDTINKGVVKELPETATSDAKRIDAVGIINLVRRHTQTAEGTKRTEGEEVANKEALLLSDWELFSPGTEVLVSVDTAYEGPVNTYDEEGKQRLDESNRPITEDTSYERLRTDPDNLPIKVEVKRGDTIIKVGHLPTSYWVGEKNAAGEFVNIAAEQEGLEDNGRVQLLRMQELRKKITGLEHGQKLSFGVTTKSPGTVFYTDTKAPVTSKMPSFLELPQWKRDIQPFGIFNKGVMIGKGTYFPISSMAVNPKYVSSLFFPGTVVMMLPTAIPNQYLPRAVSLGNVTPDLSAGITAVVKAYRTGDKETQNKIFEQADRNIKGLKDLKDFLEQFLYFTPVESIQDTSTTKPRIAFDMKSKTPTLTITSGHQVDAVIPLHGTLNTEAQMEALEKALQKFPVTVRSTLINSKDVFYVPRITEEGSLDFTATTFNQHLSEYAMTDVKENRYDEDSSPTYMVQPVVNIEWMQSDREKSRDKETIPEGVTTTEETTFDDWGDILGDDALLGEMDVSDVPTDEAAGVTGGEQFYSLSEARSLYARYELLNDKGGIKMLANDKTTKNWVKQLNRSTNYQFKLRPTSDGKHRILILKDPLKDATYGVEDAAISVAQAEQINEDAYSYIISDGDFKYSASNQQEITDMISSAVFAQLLEAEETGTQITVGEGFAHAKGIIESFRKKLNLLTDRIKTNEAFTANKEKFPAEWQFLESLSHVEFIKGELDRVLKDNVFKQFQLQVQDKLRTLNIVAREEEITDEVSGMETTLERAWENSAYLKMFGRDTAGRKVKLALAKIRDTKRNYLGIKGYVPFDTVFDDVMSIVSAKPISNTIEENAAVLKSIAATNPYKAYLEQVSDLLTSPDVSQSLKNNFQSVMMRNNNDYIFTLWTRGKRGYGYKVMDANRNNVVGRITEAWAENFAESELVTTKDGQKVLDKKAVRSKGLTVGKVKALSTDKEKEAFADRLFTALGIHLPDEAKRKLFASDDIKKDFGVGFPGGFGAQFGYNKDGTPNGLIANLVYALNVEEATTADDIMFEVNNPFTGKNSERAAKALAKIASAHTEIIYSDSHRNINGDLVNNYAFHTPETIRITALKDEGTRDMLREQPFTQDSFYLNRLDAGESIEFSLEDGMRMDGKKKGIGRAAMSDREQRMLVLGLFQQDKPRYLSLTHSDKPLTPINSAPKLSFEINTQGTERGADGVTRITKRALPRKVRTQIENLILAERKRMLNIVERIGRKEDGKFTEAELRNELGSQYFDGAQQFFFFPALNALVRNEDGNIDINKLHDMPTLLDAALGQVVDTINSTIQEWYQDGTIFREEGEWRTRFEEKYLSNLKSQALAHKIVEAAADIDINYILYNANMMMLVYGDPAMTYNKRKGVEASLEDYQKRAAKDMAPGALGYWQWSVGDYSPGTNYNVAYINDVEYGTVMDGYLSSLEAYTGKLDRTDAQELTTLDEHVDTMFAYGKLPDRIYKSIKGKINAKRGGVYKLTNEEKQFVLQPMKPVQIVRKWNAEFGFEETHYIKSSSFPLIPELTRGTDLDPIRQAMETSSATDGMGVQRLAYVSATKIGANKVNTLFDKNGVLKDDIKFEDAHINTLDREGFLIQQEIPYDESKHTIITGSQANKLLFQNLSDNLTFDFAEGKYSTSQMKSIKENIRSTLFDLSSDEINRRLGIRMQKGVPVFTDVRKLSRVLSEEAKKRGWGLNDLDGLKIIDGQVAIPFAFNNSASRVESMLLSVFNGIVKQKISGYSAVQGSSVGMRQTREFDPENDGLGGDNGIVQVKDKDGKFLFDKAKGLQYTDISKDGKKVKLAQVFAPWKFQGKMEDFMLRDENGNTYLDTDRIDPELLRSIGFRIPTQGHSSLIMIQIVGFLPQNMGDLILVPGEITKQMGSDFDVDKLYSYIYNNVVSDEGYLTRIPTEELIRINKDLSIGKDDQAIRLWVKNTFKKKSAKRTELSKKVAEYTQETENPQTAKAIDEQWTNDRMDFEDVQIDSLEHRAMQELGISAEEVNVPTTRQVARMALENSYIGIFDSVLSHAEVIKQSTNPLDKNDLEITGKAHGGVKTKPLFISRNRQMADYISQRAGKEGVGVYSRAVTGLAVIENYDITLKDDFDGFNGMRLGRLSGKGTSKFGKEGVKRSKGDNLVTQQSGAVDNARTPVLDMNNLNMQTFNVSIIISMLQNEEGEALGLEWNSYFLRQEIIRDFVREFNNLSDTLNEEYGTGSRRDQVIEKLQKEYLKRIGKDAYKRKSQFFTLSGLTNMLEASDTSTVAYVEGQLEILERFKQLDDIGQEYSTFLTAISTDSKGFGKDFFEVAKRQEQLASAKEGKHIQGLGEILQKGEHASIAKYVEQVSDALAQKFPYRQPGVEAVIHNLEKLSGKDEYIDIEFRRSVWENLKSFLFTDEGLDIHGNREELFYGENSVPRQVREAVATWGANNLYLRKLTPILAKKNGDPDMLTFTASIVERTDEINTIRHFTELFTSENEEARKLGERLVQYAYASGGIQQALQFVKYIPTAYLTNTNFASRIEGGVDTFNLAVFIEQYLQHNPQFAHNFLPDLTLDKEGKVTMDILGRPELVEKDYISKNMDKGKWMLLKRVKSDGNKHVYQQIPTLGGKGKVYTAYNEYNFNTKDIQLSTIPGNNPSNLNVVVERKINPTPKKSEDGITVPNTPAFENRTIKYNTNKKGVEGVKDLVSKLETTRYKMLGEIFSEAAELFSRFEFKVDNSLKGAANQPRRGAQKDGVVTINPKEIKVYYELEGREVTNEDMENVIMHELSHGLTTTLHHAYTQGYEHRLLTPAVKKRIENINKLHVAALSKLTKEDKIELAKLRKLLKDGAPSAPTLEQQQLLQKYYGFTSPREFIAEAMSNPVFQKKLNDTTFQGDKSLGQRFMQLLTDLFKEIGKIIGMDINQQSILAHTLSEVVGIVQDVQIAPVTQEVVSTGTEEKQKRFKGYKGGFENIGKGTPQGDGKDKAMREVADSFIGEASSRSTSTWTSYITVAGETNLEWKFNVRFVKNNPEVVMLARSSENKGKGLTQESKDAILSAHEKGVEFVVGDMPNVDSQFINYLQEIGAQFTIYHTGKAARINISTLKKEGISAEQSFKEKLSEIDPRDLETREDLAVSVKSDNLQSSIPEYIRNLNKIEREVVRDMLRKKEIKFLCR